MKRITVAFDSFKGSLTSREAAEAFAQGWHEHLPECEVCKVYIADGGEGMTEAIVESLEGEYVEVEVTGPLGRPVRARYGVIHGSTAVVELAAAAGLTLITPEERNPLIASTYGTGELLLDAARRGCKEIIVGLGGSATNDGGSGMLRALGYRFYDADGAELYDTISILERVQSIATTERTTLLDGVSLTVAVDVDNPLCGTQGAAEVFARQKGADDAMVARLDMALRHYAEVVDAEAAEVAGAGAAGGMGYAFRAVLGAQLRPGIEIVLSLVKFDDIARGADLVVTGEGSIDTQTLHGKAPAGVLAAARRHNIPVVALGGKVEGVDTLLSGGFSDVRAITPANQPLAEAMQRDIAAENMRLAAKELALSLPLLVE